MYSFIPFIFLAIINTLLIIDLRRHVQLTSESTNSAVSTTSNKISINTSVIAITLLFIVFTCPSAIASQYYNTLVTSYNGNIILFACDCFAFSYHALNIIILCMFNKQFVRKFREAFGMKRNVTS